MKKRMVPILSLCLAAMMAVPANALEYNISTPSGPEYGKATSVETVITTDGGARKIEDISKNAALIPPSFGSPSADTKGTGEYLTPNLAPGGMANGTVNGSGATVTPPDLSFIGSGSADDSVPSGGTASSASTGYTDVAAALYYSGGHLGTLKIPSLGVNVKIYEGTSSSALAKGAGHFEDTSIWDGNVALAGHNRGTNCYFGDIHTLNLGDKITLTTKLGTRTYAVISVAKISETDRSGLNPSTDNMITLYTCVRNQSAYRWCVQAVEVV